MNARERGNLVSFERERNCNICELPEGEGNCPRCERIKKQRASARFKANHGQDIVPSYKDPSISKPKQEQPEKQGNLFDE